MTIAELAARIAADPADGHALREAGLALVKDKSRTDALRALTLAARHFAEGGQLPMALVATKDVALLDAAQAGTLVDELAAAYGKGSPRVDPAFRATPPAAPGKRPAATGATLGEALDAATERYAQRAAAKGKLPSVPIFSALPAPSFVKLAQAARVRDVAENARILEIGKPGDALYVVARGVVRISRPADAKAEVKPPPAKGAPPVGEVVLSRLRPHAFFGEMALLAETPRTARATAESPVILLELARRALDELARAAPEAAQVIADYARDRLLANLMLTSALFQPLAEEARHRLVARFDRRVVDEGTRLVEEGAPGQALYVLVSGRVDVRKRDSDGSQLQVASLGPGDVVGEISLLTRRPATATVVATQKSVVLALGRDDFGAVAGQFPTVLAHLYQLAEARERDLERLLADDVVEAEDYLI